MRRVIDSEFQTPEAKALDHRPDETRASSRLASTSLVFGILSFCCLPVLGAVVAVVLGHIAMGELRAEGGRLGGRPQARAGLILGYLNLLIAVLVAAVLFLALWRLSGGAVSQVAATVVTPAHGVKLANELTASELAQIRRTIVLEPDEEVIAFDSGLGSSGSELTVLTTRRVATKIHDRVSEMPLTSIAAILTHDEYQEKYTPSHGDYTQYYIELKAEDAAGKPGARMRLTIRPYNDGPYFAEALKDAWKAVRPDPVTTEATAAPAP